MITLLSTDWGLAWGMAGISVGVVFCILLLLVAVLYLFSIFAADKSAKTVAAKPTPLAAVGKQSSVAAASESDKVALAAAIYLYSANQHDVESGVLTISHTPNSAWHAQLNKRL